MKKLVLALLTLSVMAVAHPERKAPPPPKHKKHHPVRIVERPMPVIHHGMISPIHHSVQDGVYTVRYTPNGLRNEVTICTTSGHCTLYRDINYEYNDRYFIILQGNNARYDLNRFTIEIVNYR